MAKKVFIGVGHGGSDSGAVGYIREETVNLKMALACRDYLAAYDCSVKLSRTKDENDPLSEEIKECNAFITKRADGVAVDIHNNAGGGDGFEAYYSKGSAEGKALALAIEKQIKGIGQNSRGCKTRLNSSGKDYYGFNRQTIAPAVIVEAVFVDNKADAAQADTDAECKAFGEAIAKGIVAHLGLKKKATAKPAAKPASSTAAKPAVSGTLYEVTASALNIRSGVGTNYEVTGVIKDKGVYTIVETKKSKDGGTWGKLKSGAGWINLKYAKRV